MCSVTACYIQHNIHSQTAMSGAECLNASPHWVTGISSHGYTRHVAVQTLPRMTLTNLRVQEPTPWQHVARAVLLPQCAAADCCGQPPGMPAPVGQQLAAALPNAHIHAAVVPRSQTQSMSPAKLRQHWISTLYIMSTVGVMA